jgi:hypothetical protein
VSLSTIPTSRANENISGRVRRTGARSSIGRYGCRYCGPLLLLLYLLHSQPRNAISPSALSPGSDPEVNPFETEFNSDDDEEDDDDGLDFSTPPLDEHEVNNFAVLDSSLPEQLPEPHHLVSYANAKRSQSGKRGKKPGQRWHFGIRSSSPPLQVMSQLYEALKSLGMEWKEKEDLGGLGGIRPSEGRNGRMERARELDGAGAVDLKAAVGIYFVEVRTRIHDVVVISISDALSFCLSLIRYIILIRSCSISSSTKRMQLTLSLTSTTKSHTKPPPNLKQANTTCTIRTLVCLIRFPSQVNASRSRKGIVTI